MGVTKKAVAVVKALSGTEPKPDGLATVKEVQPTEWVGGMTVDLRLFALLLGAMVLAFIVGAVFG
jgi:hypothetical protein